MEQTAAGELVRVTSVGGRETDAIIFDATGGAKVVVALVDRVKGPVLRSVALSALSAREEAGADDRALRALIRRTPHGVRGAAHAGASGAGPSAGHQRATGHRTTGK
jgi:hypothetical protein